LNIDWPHIGVALRGVEIDRKILAAPAVELIGADTAG
jgi:hypothetical protein